MSMDRKRFSITLPNYVADFLDGLMDDLGFNRSDLIEECILFTSQDVDGFLDQFDLTEEEPEEEPEEEEE